jgi:Na+/proline symporter
LVALAHFIQLLEVECEYIYIYKFVSFKLLPLVGIRAVIWTDVFQVIVMFSGVILVITKGTIDVGGFNEVINISQKGGRLELFNFDFNPLVRQSFWSLFFGMTVYFSM